MMKVFAIFLQIVFRFSFSLIPFVGGCDEVEDVDLEYFLKGLQISPLHPFGFVKDPAKQI